MKIVQFAILNFKTASSYYLAQYLDSFVKSKLITNTYNSGTLTIL